MRGQQSAFGHRYGYQGEFAEVDEETGWNAFELRMYEPVVGSFGIDFVRIGEEIIICVTI